MAPAGAPLQAAQYLSLYRDRFSQKRMEYGSFIAAAIGFAPAIALMLWTLQRYTYPKVEKPYFSDPTLFGMFAGGIIIGVILHAVGVIFSAYYFFVAFLLEELVKLLILNLPRYQRRAED